MGKKDRGITEDDPLIDPKQKIVAYNKAKDRFTLEPTSKEEPRPESIRSATSIIRIKHKERETWGNRAEFLLTTVSMAVGVGNVWRFPYLAYENGGGTFLIPYLCAMLFLGIPIFFLEQAIGQKFRKGNYHSMREIDTRLKGLGIANAFVSSIGALYYNVLIAWSLWYFVYSFNWGNLQWENNESNYWFIEVLQVGKGYFSFESFNWKMMLFLAWAWLIIYCIVRKGIATTGKVVYVTATFPYVFLIILLVRGLLLEGSGAGIKFYMVGGDGDTPDFSKIGDPLVWSSAATQIFFSLSLGWGAIPAYGSYNDPSENVQQDAFIVPIINSATSILAGFVIFGILGGMAHDAGLTVDKVVQGSGTGLAFITYPKGLTQLPAPTIWCAFFFVMLIILGVGSEFSMVEVILTLAKDLKLVRLTSVVQDDAASVADDLYGQDALASRKARYRVPQAYFTAGVCCVGWLLGTLFFATSAGIYWFDFFNHWLSVALTPLVFIECIAVAWIYGAERFLDELSEPIKGRIWKPFWAYMWRYIVPLLLLAVTITSVIASIQDPGGPLNFSYQSKTPTIVIPDDGSPPYVYRELIQYTEAAVAIFFGYVVGYFPLAIVIGCGIHEQIMLMRRKKESDSFQWPN